MKIYKYEWSYTRRCVAEYPHIKDSELTSPEEAAHIVYALPQQTVESLQVLYLNAKGKIVGLHTASTGGVCSTAVDMRGIFTPAIQCGTYAIIIAHNHPSGDTSPSKDDKAITKQIKEAGKILDIRLLDHIIIGQDEADGYYSFKEHGAI